MGPVVHFLTHDRPHHSSSLAMPRGGYCHLQTAPRGRRKTTGPTSTDDRDELVSVIKDAVDMMGTTTHPPQILDENDHFAHFIAHGLRKLPNLLIREGTKLRIHELLFEARFVECPRSRKACF